ncbi:MAG: hypothetical protein ACFE94_14015 [Candidatus Hodarchaeota archaeon]
MGSENLKEIYYKINDFFDENTTGFDVNYSKIVIPFSKMFKRYKQMDIYSGEEKIPFKERDQEFKMILRQEFKEI